MITELILLVPLVLSSGGSAETAQDPCTGADDVDSCHRRLAGLIATFPDAELRSQCGALDHFPPMPDNDKPKPPPPQFESGASCSSAEAWNECYNHIRWAHDEGKWTRPEWYGMMPYYVVDFVDLNSATFDDFQMYFYCNPYFADMPHNCGVPVCGRSCPEPGDQEWEDVKTNVDNEIDTILDTHNPQQLYDWCYSDQAHYLVKWDQDNTVGNFDCGEVYPYCTSNPSGSDCYDVANQFCNDQPVAPYTLHQMCGNADGQELNNQGYDHDSSSLVVGGGRRLLRKYRIPWWRWFLCHAANGFSLVLFGGVGLYSAANCDLFMTRLVINCLVFFGPTNPLAAVCMAGWMVALTHACQALVGAITLTVQAYFLWAVRCGPKPSYDPNGRRLLDLPGNPNHVAFADVPYLPKIHLPGLLGRRLMEASPVKFQVTNFADACGCLSNVSEDQSKALVSVVGDGLKDLQSKCQAVESDESENSSENSSDCSAIVTRVRCNQVDGCRFDKATKSCMDDSEEESVCGGHRHRVKCRAEPGCVWEDQRCVKGEDAPEGCIGLTKKQCKKSDSCHWKRKEKMCME